jgi:hypothetical protein
MPCNASYAILFLEGFSYAQEIEMQPICTSIPAKFYSWKMWVLHHQSSDRWCNGLNLMYLDTFEGLGLTRD